MPDAARFNVTCPNCEKTLRLSARPTVGRKVKCPSCQEPFVPEIEAEEAEASGKERHREQRGADRPRKKKSQRQSAGGALVLVLLGVGLVVCLGLFAVGAFVWPGFLVNRDNASQNTSKSGDKGAGGDKGTGGDRAADR